MNKALENLKKLKDVYADYETVKVGDKLTAKLKNLSSEEETEVSAYSFSYSEAGLAFFYTVKRETLCRAIVALNDEEIPEFVEEDNGEKIQKHVWIRNNIIKGWSQLIIDEMWKGYDILQNRLEKKIVGDVKEEKKETEVK